MKVGKADQAHSPLAAYERNAAAFVKDYESLKFEEVHSFFLDLLPRKPACVLDVGAGSGRDASELANRGYHVDAVEPSGEMRRLASILHTHPNINWIDDHLPSLCTVTKTGRRYGLILLSAVWMHIEPSKRPIAMQTLENLLTVGGVLVISLRIGSADNSRGIFEVSESELLTLGKTKHLTILRSSPVTTDKLNRSEIQWKTVVFKKSKSIEDKPL